MQRMTWSWLVATALGAAAPLSAPAGSNQKPKRASSTVSTVR